MSTSALPRMLFEHLFDDAAVFPPGNFPLVEAIERLVSRHDSSIEDFVGPLLLPIPLLEAALSTSARFTISTVGRPGTPLADLIAAAHVVMGAEGHTLAGVEMPYDRQWRDALDLGVPLAIEVPHGEPGLRLLPDLSGAGRGVRAKLRTGSTPENPVPTSRNLAQFISSCVSRNVPFKLTGGLHHAMTGTYDEAGRREDQFGFLNILAATYGAIRGDGPRALDQILAQRHSGDIVDCLCGLSEHQIMSVRSSFQSFGCCNVLDPIHHLAQMSLIKETIR